MGLIWPVISSVSGDLPEGDRVEATAVLNDFGDRVSAELSALRLPTYASPLWKPWNLVLVQDAEKIIAAFSPSSGLETVRWLSRKSEIFPPEELERAVKEELGMTVNALVTLPLPQSADRDSALNAAAMQHIANVERSNRLGKLGDLTGLRHLEPHLRDFLNDYPDSDRNVFIMMRFQPSQQLRDVHSAIVAALKQRGFNGVRADDRDYTQELWSNIEVYMACCRYGIAVIETMDSSDFNPNVSLELGYMLGRGKRVLILKEKRLPNLPSDVVNRLYKPFDMFNVTSTVSREVGRWVDVDLGLGSGPAS